MPSLGELTVSLGAVTGKFREDLNESKGALRSTATAMRGVVNVAGQLGVAAGVAGAAMLAGLVKSGLQVIDSQAKLARNINASIGGLRALEMAAGDAGVASTELSAATEMLTMRLGEAARGEGRAKDMLDALGLSAKDLMRLDVDARFAAIADRVKELGLSTEQTADLLRQFGIRSLEMVDLMRNGGDAIREQAQEVDRLGLRLSAVDARQVEMANDAMGVFSDVLTSIRDKVTVALAPLITELSERFRDTAVKAGGFGGHAAKAAEVAIRSFGKVLDVIHGLRVTIKAAELVAKGFGAAFISAGQLILEMYAAVNDGLTKLVNVGIRALNKLGANIQELPSISDSEFMQGVRKFGEEARNEVGRVREEFHDLAMQETPSAKYEKFLTAVKNRSTEAAEGLERVQRALGGGAEGFAVKEEGEDEDDKREQEKLERLKESLKARVEAIEQSLLDEEGLQQDKYLRDLEALVQAREMELLTKQQYDMLEQDLENAHMEAMKEIRERNMTDIERFMAMSYGRQAATVATALSNMTAGVAQHSKTMFNINKAAGIAQATIAMFTGIAEGVKLGWPLSIPAVAYAAAEGAAAIAGIKSASFGGGSAAPPPSAAAPPISGAGGGMGAPGGGGGSEQIVRVQGLDPTQMFSGRQVVDLLNNAVKDGAKLVIE